MRHSDRLCPHCASLRGPQRRGGVADFPLPQQFAQWFFRKVPTDREDRRRVGLAGGEGHPGSGNWSTQTQTAGPRKNVCPSKSLAHLSIFSSFWDRTSCRAPWCVWQLCRGPHIRDAASGAHRGGGTRGFVGASLMPVCITL